MPGVPSIYYGSEWGIKVEKGTGENADDSIRLELNRNELEDSNKELVEHIKNAFTHKERIKCHKIWRLRGNISDKWTACICKIIWERTENSGS